MFLISWALSPFLGILAGIGLAMAWGAVFAIPLAILGILRRRCKWWLAPLFFGLGLLFSGIYQGAFWVQGKLPSYDPHTDDKIMAGLFFGGMVLAGLGALTQVKPFFKEIWARTNSPVNSP
jgi:hypothetical protein